MMKGRSEIVDAKSARKSSAVGPNEHKVEAKVYEGWIVVVAAVEISSNINSGPFHEIELSTSCCNFALTIGTIRVDKENITSLTNQTEI
jgi:hypothetical protein